MATSKEELVTGILQHICLKKDRISDRSHVFHICILKQGFTPDELQDVLQIATSKEELVTGILQHTSTSVYVFCTDVHYAERILRS